MLKFKAFQGSVKVNSIRLLKENDDVILLHIDFAQKNFEYDGYCSSLPLTEVTFYFGDGEGDSDDSRVDISGFPPSWEDAKIHILFEQGKYSAYLSLIKIEGAQEREVEIDFS